MKTNSQDQTENNWVRVLPDHEQNFDVEGGKYPDIIYDNLPPLAVCEECMELGYCKDFGNVINENGKRTQEISEQFLAEKIRGQELKRIRSTFFDINNLPNLIPYGSLRGLSRHLRQANEAFHSDNFEEAYQLFTHEVGSYPFNHAALVGTALSLFYLERYSESIDAIRKCEEGNLPAGMLDSFLEAAEKRQWLNEKGDSINEIIPFPSLVKEGLTERVL